MKKFNLIPLLILILTLTTSVHTFAEEPALPANNTGAPITSNPLLPDLNSTQVELTASTDSNEAVAAASEESFEAAAADSESQAAQFDRRSQDSDFKLTESLDDAVAEVIGCSAGQILANVLASLVSSAITAAVELVVDTAEQLVKVPTVVGGQTLLNSKTQSSAEVGTTIGAFGVGVLALPSWNSIAYCVVNAMITYVANSTIAWVQGGFEGNPSFVTNPEEFFKDLANLEASAFLQELAYGVTGLNICEPFRAQIVLTIARDYVGNQQGYGGNSGYSQGGFGGYGGNVGYGGCSLDDIEGNLEGFLRGDFTRGGWDSWFQISQIDTNNPYATYFNLQSQLNGSISRKQNLATIELDWGKGFLSFRKCEEDTPESEKGNCPITSPGVVIQGQLEKTLGLAKDRLVLAEKFDQVIAAVVNQLIQVALDKVLESVEE